MYSMPYKVKGVLILTCWSTSKHENGELKKNVTVQILNRILKRTFITAILSQSKFNLHKLAFQVCILS